MDSDRPNTFEKKETTEEKVDKVEDIKPQPEANALSDQMEEWKQYAGEYKEKAQKYIKENPEKSFFMGMGIGALLALIFFRRR